MTSATELKTCPFCGGKAVMKHVRQIWEPRERYWAACQSCHMSGKHYCTEVEAIEAWNTRPVETCEMEYVSDFMSWHCKACDMMDMAPRDPKPRFCKWCGRKVDA